MTNASKTAGEIKLKYTLGWNVTWQGSYGNQWPRDPVTLLLGVYQDSKSAFHRDACTVMFIAVLSTRARIREVWMPIHR